MASFKASEEARQNRLASMTDRRAEPGPPATTARSNQFQGRTQLREACLIRLDRLAPDPNQPRTEFDADDLARLAGSLKERGQLQPIRVRWDEPADRYVVVVGERRWRAARLAGLEALACVVLSGNPAPDDLLEDQLIENCLREDLKPIEQANAYQSLMKRRGLSLRQLAERLRVTPGAISKAMALLDLPESIQAQVEEGVLPPATAYEISRVPDREGREALAARAVERKLTRAEVVAERDRKGPATGPRKFEHKDPNGCKVTLTIADGLGPDDALAALQRAVKEFRKRLVARPDAA